MTRGDESPSSIGKSRPRKVQTKDAPERAGFPLALELDIKGLPKKSWLKISQVRTLSTRRIRGRLGHVSPEVLDRAIEGLNEIIS